VHLSEWIDLYGRRVYVNPLHPRMKLAPYVETEAPGIRAIAFYRPAMPAWAWAAGQAVFPQAGKQLPASSTGRALLSGRVDVRARIVSPSHPDRIDLQVIRESDGRPVLTRTVFRSAVLLSDSRAMLPVPIGYHYAPGTTQSARLCPNVPECGRVYWFRLFARPTAAYWNTAAIPDGDYRLRVSARDVAGNSASAVARVTIRNAPR
jgi:hypothetical protein